MRNDPQGVIDPFDSPFPGAAVRYPGLIPEAHEIETLARSLTKYLAVFSYSRRLPCLWVVFLGGTGTGKSTLFNALCGRRLSETGVERPKTGGPIAYAHRHCDVDKGFPFPGIEVRRTASDDPAVEPTSGQPGRLTVLDHDRAEWSHLILVDTPDLDSVEKEHRQFAEDMYLLSQAVIFVTSQEKYADEAPYLFFMRLIQEKKPCFLILNKAEEKATHNEILETLGGDKIALKKDRLWLIPYASSDPSLQISEYPGFQDLLARFSQDLSKEGTTRLRKSDLSRQADQIQGASARLLDLCQAEGEAAKAWSKELHEQGEEISREFVAHQRERFAGRSQEILGREIRRLFARYDVLAAPRRFVQEIFLAPFRFLGLIRRGVQGSQNGDLLKVRQMIDLVPLGDALAKLNRLVLERLSPSEERAPLFKSLRQPDLILGEEEVRDLVMKEQDQLYSWLRETFDELSRGIPASKKWGIYTTSILWGILILSFQTAVGGGFTVIDAALDSALGPLVTKGTVELFAYYEIRKIAGELAKRYREGLLSVLRRQEDRYKDCLESLLTPKDTLEVLVRLRNEIARWQEKDGE